MKLYFSPTSPFVRKVQIVAIEKGLDGRIEKVPAREPGVDLERRNPLNKIPTLETDDGEVLIESALISQYLDEIGGSPRLYPPASDAAARRRVLQIEALAHGVLDAVVLCRMEERMREPQMRSAAWLERQEKKVRLGLAALEEALGRLGDAFTAAHITVACLLFFIEQHKMFAGWRQERPRLAAWYDAVRKRPSVAATEPKAA